MELMDKNRLFCIKNTSTGFYFNGLNYSEFYVAASIINKANGDNWIYWLEGWEKWAYLNEIELDIHHNFREVSPPDLDKSNCVKESDEYKIQATSPNVEMGGVSHSKPSSINAYRTIEFDESGTEVQVEGQGSLFQARKFERLKKTIHVTIEYDDNKLYLDTQSIDISVGGIALEENIPLEIQGRCRVRLVKSSGESVALYAQPVEPRERQRRNRLEFVKFKNSNDEMSFHKWLIL